MFKVGPKTQDAVPGPRTLVELMHFSCCLFENTQVLARDKPRLYPAACGAFRASTLIALLAKKYKLRVLRASVLNTQPKP